MQTHDAKLLAIQDKRKRWQSRLTRAVNALNKLDRQQARLMKPAKPNGKPKQAPVSDVTEISWSEMTGADLVEPKKLDEAIPVILQRSHKQAVTDEQKKKMPLSGREAEKFLKEQSAKVTAKRAKKELRLR